jgi:hypothetical protein
MARFWRRVGALVEVAVALVVVHLMYRTFRHFTPLGQAESSAGLNFSSGAVRTLFTVALLAVGRRSFEDYGLTIKGWCHSLNVGLLWGLLIVIVGGVVITRAHVHFDPLQPPDLQRAILFTIGELVNTVVLLLFLRQDCVVVQRLPLAASLLILLAVLSAPCVIALWFDRPVLDVMLSTLWLFFCAGFGEEIFFRGYVRSRVDEALGHPFRFSWRRLWSWTLRVRSAVRSDPCLQHGGLFQWPLELRLAVVVAELWGGPVLRHHLREDWKCRGGWHNPRDDRRAGAGPGTLAVTVFRRETLFSRTGGG